MKPKRVKTQDLQPGDVLIRPYEGWVVASVKVLEDRVAVSFTNKHMGKFFYDRPWKVRRDG